jgi:hypothetical protein
VKGHGEGGETAPPRSVQEALLRGRDHARISVGEAAAAARCVLDALSLAATGVPASGHEVLRDATAWLERASALAEAEGSEARWLAGVADALDAEVARWEARGRDDPEARAVLRAFLGVREVLWEFGLRPDGGRTARGRARAAQSRPARAAERRPPRPAPPPMRASGRLERVPVEG